MIDVNQLDQYIESLEKLLLFLREYRNKKYEDNHTGDYLLEFHHLKELLRSSAWPQAILPEFLCKKDSEEDKEDRAINILMDLIPLDNLIFLDYGCGEGHVAWQASEKTEKAVGYDIEPHSWGRWTKENLYFTTNAQDLPGHGPYDVIMLHDVLDHYENPVGILKQVKAMRHDNGPIYIHCHPWASRHATHLYHDINKAFLHLVFSEQELLKLGYKGRKTHKLLNSIETYRKWFAEAGLEIKMEAPNRKPIEDFFYQNSLVHKRMKAHWPGPFPQQECSLEFVDYIVA